MSNSIFLGGCLACPQGFINYNMSHMKERYQCSKYFTYISKVLVECRLHGNDTRYENNMAQVSKWICKYIWKNYYTNKNYTYVYRYRLNMVLYQTYMSLLLFCTELDRDIEHLLQNRQRTLPHFYYKCQTFHIFFFYLQHGTMWTFVFVTHLFTYFVHKNISNRLKVDTCLFLTHDVPEGLLNMM